MIPLFKVPDHRIDTDDFDNLLQGETVTNFEEKFAKYVNAKYAVSFNSASSALFLIFQEHASPGEIIKVPSIIPPVVPNAIKLAKCAVEFTNNTHWVGDSYLLHTFGSSRQYNIWDSAQRVDRAQYSLEKMSDNDLMVFSFYPTKPVSGCDGGMVVSDNKLFIDGLRMMANNGMTTEANNWERTQKAIGYKMYMNSIQAYIADRNLDALEFNQERLEKIRFWYNKSLDLKNTSNHLYRIKVKNNKRFLEIMNSCGVTCGIHYAAAHRNQLFNTVIPDIPEADKVAATTVSIPFYPELQREHVSQIIQLIKKHKDAS